jgi:hypothetical protein
LQELDPIVTAGMEAQVALVGQSLQVLLYRAHVWNPQCLSQFTLTGTDVMPLKEFFNCSKYFGLSFRELL